MMTPLQKEQIGHKIAEGMVLSQMEAITLWNAQDDRRRNDDRIPGLEFENQRLSETVERLRKENPHLKRKIWQLKRQLAALERAYGAKKYAEQMVLDGIREVLSQVLERDLEQFVAS